MHLDVQDLKNFYWGQPLGRVVKEALRKEVLTFWPDLTGRTLVGYGFAVPLLRPYLKQARRIIALMPGPQGVMSWPAAGDNMTVLVDEAFWPLETGHVDRLIILHGLETGEDANSVLEEAIRVLGPGGRAIFIVPNRAGFWSRSEKTPMGFGRPYTISQLETQLRLHGFCPERIGTALYQWPSLKAGWQRLGPFFERIGRNLPAFAGGVLLVEASKKNQLLPSNKYKSPSKQTLGVLGGIRSGKTKPAM